MRAIIADDHQIIRVGLSAILGAEPDIQVIGEATSAREALALVAREKPDIAILDLNFPDGSALTVLPDLLAASPDTRVLVLTMHSEAQVVRTVAGAAEIELRVPEPGEHPRDRASRGVLDRLLSQAARALVAVRTTFGLGGDHASA